MKIFLSKRSDPLQFGIRYNYSGPGSHRARKFQIRLEHTGTMASKIGTPGYTSSHLWVWSFQEFYSLVQNVQYENYALFVVQKLPNFWKLMTENRSKFCKIFRGKIQHEIIWYLPHRTSHRPSRPRPYHSKVWAHPECGAPRCTLSSRRSALPSSAGTDTAWKIFTGWLQLLC